MIIGTGIDIIEISRIKKAVARWNSKFLKRIFTENEISYSNGKTYSYQHLAARFAAKEAVLKAFGGGWNKRTEWTDIEIYNEKTGKPRIKLYGPLKDLEKKMMIEHVIISLSHTQNYAVANAILVSSSQHFNSKQNEKKYIKKKKRQP